MSDLARFQAAFAVALADDDGVISDLALARALSIHRNTSVKAAIDALAANFPVVRRLVGEASFSAAAFAFVRAQPPGEPRLCVYGADFPAFLAAYAPYAEAAYLADVAVLERLYTEALFAADAEPLDGAAALVGLDLETPLPLHPACRAHAFAAPAASLWSAHQDDAAEPALDRLVWGGEQVLITRPAGEVHVASISQGAFAFLAACRSGRPLGEAAVAAAGSGEDLASLFATLITAGAFADTSHPSELNI